jgi:hypothetical protein
VVCACIERPLPLLRTAHAGAAWWQPPAPWIPEHTASAGLQSVLRQPPVETFYRSDSTFSLRRPPAAAADSGAAACPVLPVSSGARLIADTSFAVEHIPCSLYNIGCDIGTNSDIGVTYDIVVKNSDIGSDIVYRIPGPCHLRYRVLTSDIRVKTPTRISVLILWLTRFLPPTISGTSS